jgi:flavin-dependent dehydrogenase
VLFEAGKLPRHKVCGEFVSGEAIALLEQLLGSSERLSDAPHIVRSRVFLDGHVVDFPVTPAGASFTRHDLDSALWQAAVANGVDAQMNSRVVDVVNANGVHAIQLQDREVRARVVVNASGRWSNLQTSPLPEAPAWIGVKSHFYERMSSQSCDLYFFDGGYCGVQPLGQGIVNAAALVDPAVARNLDKVFSLNQALWERSRSWQRITDQVSTAPLFFRAPKTSDRGMLLVGDAAAFLDPFAGDGISMALHSGRLAVGALAPYLRSEYSFQIALRTYDSSHKELLQPVLKNAARLRRLLYLPRPLRRAAIFLLQFPMLAQLAVQETRVRRAA